jgi:hypothetical protein
VVRLAITGEALLPCCRSTADLLARNLLDAVGVWWFPGMVLQVTALLAAGLWGAAVAGGSYLYWGRSQVRVCGAGGTLWALGGLVALRGCEFYLFVYTAGHAPTLDIVLCWWRLIQD